MAFRCGEYILLAARRPCTSSAALSKASASDPTSGSSINESVLPWRQGEFVRTTGLVCTGRCPVVRCVGLGRVVLCGGGGGVPVDVVAVGGGGLFAVGGHFHDGREGGVAEDAGKGGGGFAAVDAGGLFDDAFDAGAAERLEAGERHFGGGQVAQALGEDDGVFDGQGGALAGGGGGGVAASPMTIMRPLCQNGRWGMEWMGLALLMPAVSLASTSRAAGPASAAYSAASLACHWAAVIASASPRAGSSRRGMLANHHTSPLGART